MPITILAHTPRGMAASRAYGNTSPSCGRDGIGQSIKTCHCEFPQDTTRSCMELTLGMSVDRGLFGFLRTQIEESAEL